MCLPNAEGRRVRRAALVGELVGESHADLGTGSTANSPTRPRRPFRAPRLVRIDFAAAGTLLNWVMARDARGQRVHFVDAHRLIGPFFNVIGIADHATVAVRAD